MYPFKIFKLLLPLRRNDQNIADYFKLASYFIK